MVSSATAKNQNYNSKKKHTNGLQLKEPKHLPVTDNACDSFANFTNLTSAKINFINDKPTYQVSHQDNDLNIITMEYGNKDNNLVSILC